MSVGFVVVVVTSAALAMASAAGAAPERPYAVAPLVVSSPSFGTGGGAAGMLFYRPTKGDTISPNSITVVVGLYSNTKSYALAGFSRNYFDEDAWRLTVGLGSAHVNCDYDFPYGSVQFATNTRFALTRAEWRARQHVYFGALVAATGIKYEQGNPESGIFFDVADVQDNTAGVFGPTAAYDTKDNQYFPESGSYADFSYTAVPEWLGSSAGYWIAQAEGDWYRSVRPRTVIATRLYGRFTPQGTPYSGLSTLGRRSDLRGYKSGKLTAENLMSTQAEVRWMFHPLLGAAGFVGAAALYDGSFNNLRNDNLYTSGGMGLRIVLQKTNRMNLRIDYAWGEQDEQGAYVSVGEAF